MTEMILPLEANLFSDILEWLIAIACIPVHEEVFLVFQPKKVKHSKFWFFPIAVKERFTTRRRKMSKKNSA